MTDRYQAGAADVRALVQPLDGDGRLSFRAPSNPPRATRTSETAPSSPDVDELIPDAAARLAAIMATEPPERAELRARAMDLDHALRAGDHAGALRVLAAGRGETPPLPAPLTPGRADEPPTEQAEHPEVKRAQEGSKAIRLCAKCGARLSPRSRAHRVYCSHTCRGRAAKLRALLVEADRPALPRVARARLAELRAEERRPSVAPYPPEEGRR